MFNPALFAITCYFLLNLIVTISNKQVVSQTFCPHLLTATHAFCTLITTHFVSSFSDNIVHHHRRTQSTTFARLGVRAHTVLVCFSLLYTINIAISNLSLGLVSLSLHQTIRATAPAITVLISVLLLNRSLSSYSTSTYLSLIPIIAGVILATTSPTTHDTARQRQETPSLKGIIITLVGAVLAVFKTILTNALQRKQTTSRTGQSAPRLNLSLNLSPTTLIRYTAPYAVLQALLFAWWAGEFLKIQQVLGRIRSNAAPLASDRTIVVTGLNVIAAALLNIASFEANRRCGPLAMAVVANLKQVVILILGRQARNDGVPDGGRVVVGALMTIVGGAWFAWAQRKGNLSQDSRKSETESILG